MKILVLLSRVPYPLEKGDKLRAFHQIKELAKRHKIVLFAINEGPLHPDARQILESFCSRVVIMQHSRFTIIVNTIKAFLKGRPAQTGYFFSQKSCDELHMVFNEERPDHVYCQLARMAEYTHKMHVEKTIDYMDVFSEGLRRRIQGSSGIKRFFFKKEHERMKRYENHVFDLFQNHTIISIPDRNLIPHIRRAEISVIENGVDTEFYSRESYITDSGKRVQQEYDLVFTGNMNYPPNIQGAIFLVKEIMPVLKGKGFHLKCLIAGATPAPEVKALASADVTVTGWVDDIRESYASGSIFIAPMQIGTGLQNKILEAMSMGLPCITTPLAFEPLNAVADYHLLVGDGAEELADKIIFLKQNDAVANQMVVNARDFVETNYSWSVAGQKLEKVILGGRV